MCMLEIGLCLRGPFEYFNIGLSRVRVGALMDPKARSLHSVSLHALIAFDRFELDLFNLSWVFHFPLTSTTYSLPLRTRLTALICVFTIFKAVITRYTWLYLGVLLLSSLNTLSNCSPFLLYVLYITINFEFFPLI